MNAGANGDTRKVLQLLDQGLNVNVTFPRDESEFSGMTILMVASSHGYAEMVEELIKRGADVNLKRYVGDTPLMFAARTGNVKTVNALLRAGANPNATVMSPHAGEITPLNSAINSDSPNRVEIAKILIGARAEINPRGDFFASPLMNAVGDLEMVKLLIASGANVNQKNFRGATALMVASGAGPASVVRYLLEKGADVNARDREGHNALEYAEERRELLDPSRREEIMQVLRKAKSPN
jgi:ankyrin repeat protein